MVLVPQCSTEGRPNQRKMNRRGRSWGTAMSPHYGQSTSGPLSIQGQVVLSEGSGSGKPRPAAPGHLQLASCAGSGLHPPGPAVAALTSASTSFFLMPSDESSRFCSLSSSRSARSLACRMFCSSSVASVLALTACRKEGAGGISWIRWSTSPNQAHHCPGTTSTTSPLGKGSRRKGEKV